MTSRSILLPAALSFSTLVSACGTRDAEVEATAAAWLTSGSLDTTWTPPATYQPLRVIPRADDGAFVVDGWGPTLFRLDASGAKVGVGSPSGPTETNDRWGVARLAGGGLLAGSHRHNTLFRFDDQGAIDHGFAGATVPFRGPATWDGLEAVAVDAENHVLVGGAKDGGGTLARYNSDLTLDLTFATSGTAGLDRSVCDSIREILPLASGSIMVRCHSMAIYRLTANGQVDPTYGSGGVRAPVSKPMSTSPTAMPPENFQVTGSALASDGSVYVVGLRDAHAGRAVDGPNHNILPWYRDLMVWHFAPNGTLDASFGSDGSAIHSLNPAEDIWPTIHLDPSGKIVVASTFEDLNKPAPRAQDTSIWRFTSTGAVDSAFGTSGRTILDLGGAKERILDVAVAANGKILVSGEGSGGGFIARVNP